MLPYAALRQSDCPCGNPTAPFAPPPIPTNMPSPTSQKAGAMAIEKCINEFDVDDVIFEEGSTGRELFVVLDGKVEIAKVNGSN
jgi:hypothetical protein